LASAGSPSEQQLGRGISVDVAVGLNPSIALLSYEPVRVEVGKY
jgi:hypothetical protein